MAFRKKVWKNRLTEFPRRRSLTSATGGAPIDIVDIARAEGEIYQEGDTWSAENMNDMEDRVKEAFDSDSERLSALQTALNSLSALVNSINSTLSNAISNLDSSKVNKSDVIAVNRGGTGAQNATTARSNLGLSYGSTAGTVCQGNDSRLSNKREPTSHASSGTGYGVGSGVYYGHVKLSDAINSTSSTGGGVAATPAAINSVYNLALSKSNLKIQVKTGLVNSGQTKTYIYDGFNHIYAAIPYCTQVGFQAGATIAAEPVGTITVQVSQYNTANASMEVAVACIGD